MKLFSRYVGFVYFKYFLILFIALEFFYIGIDILTNLKDLPKSANLQLLYVGLTSLSAISYTLPLSLIFALIITKFNMIRSNELVSFYSLGISKNSLIASPFFIALFITLGYILLNTTPFAYATEYQKNISNFNQINRTSSDMFLKYEGKYIYIKELNPLASAANDIKIFDYDGNKLISKVEAKSAVYDSKKWSLNDVNTTTLPKTLEPAKAGLSWEVKKLEEGLKGFDPKTIVSVYDSANSYTIPSAFNSIQIFKNQGVNVNGIKASLYNMIFFPLFAPFMVLILYYYLPITARFFNLALLSFGFFIATLCVWGMLFVLVRFSLNGVVLPEIGIIMPILTLFLFSLYLVFKNR